MNFCHRVNYSGCYKPFNFTEKTFTNWLQTAKFAKVISLESFLLYGSNPYKSGICECKLALLAFWTTYRCLLAVQNVVASCPLCVCAGGDSVRMRWTNCHMQISARSV